ncbi:hypothetical protein GCM10009565_52010 [Amycolatopsis albidoflavus]
MIRIGQKPVPKLAEYPDRQLRAELVGIVGQKLVGECVVQLVEGRRGDDRRRKLAPDRTFYARQQYLAGDELVYSRVDLA